MQSVSAAQLTLHEVAPHVYAPHDLGTSPQLPEPSHALTCFSVPELHVAAPHEVLPPGKLHFAVSIPLHVEAHAASPDDEGHARRVPCGGPTTGEHVPTLPATLHAWHCPVHVVSQHTPSTQ
jgi:hypothetical protein